MQFCGKEFSRKYNGREPKFCSLECFGKDLEEKWQDQPFREKRIQAIAEHRGQRPSGEQLEMIGILKDRFKFKLTKADYPIKAGGTVYYADVANLKNKIDFEYDSIYWHQFKDDEKRDKDLEEKGWLVLHIYDDLDIENQLVANIEGRNFEV